MPAGRECLAWACRTRLSFPEKGCILLQTLVSLVTHNLPASLTPTPPTRASACPQVDYPEHVGMLHRLLSPLSPRWDITLLHFRKTGNRSATALLGLRLPEEEVADFWRAIGELSAEVGSGEAG